MNRAQSPPLRIGAARCSRAWSCTSEFLRASRHIYFKMDVFEGALAEQVRMYRHLYDTSARDPKDNQMAQNSWKEIAAALKKDETICRKAWKNMRDRFVKAKKRFSRSGDPGGNKPVPTILLELEWLAQFVKHRMTDSSLDKEAEEKSLQSRVEEHTMCLPPTTDHPIASTPVSRASPHATTTPIPIRPPEPSLYTTLPRSLPESSSSSSSTSPSPNISSSDSSKPIALGPTAHSPIKRPSKRRACDALVRRLELINREMEKINQERERINLEHDKQPGNEDKHFSAVVADLLSRIHVDHKSAVKFKIHQLLFEAEQNYPVEK